MLDPLLHRSVVLAVDGDSYRMRSHRARAEAMRRAGPGRVSLPVTPSRHDSVTMACPVCRGGFSPAGRRWFCSDACRAAACRARRPVARPLIVVPAGAARVPMTVYECDGCRARALGERRCTDCSAFMRRVSIGGACPSCGGSVNDPPDSVTYPCRGA